MTDAGLYLWLFILIGNAVAFVAVSSMSSGGTSAMASRDRSELPPKF